MDKGGSRTAATSKMECFVIIANGWNPLTIITKHSILDVAAALDPPLVGSFSIKLKTVTKCFEHATFHNNLKYIVYE